MLGDEDGNWAVFSSREGGMWAGSSGLFVIGVRVQSKPQLRNGAFEFGDAYPPSANEQSDRPVAMDTQMSRGELRGSNQALEPTGQPIEFNEQFEPLANSPSSFNVVEIPRQSGIAEEETEAPDKQEHIHDPIDITSVRDTPAKQVFGILTSRSYFFEIKNNLYQLGVNFQVRTNYPNPIQFTIDFGKDGNQNASNNLNALIGEFNRALKREGRNCFISAATQESPEQEVTFTVF